MSIAPGSPWSFSGTCWWPHQPRNAFHCATLIRTPLFAP
jgi:hypothetical protein